MKITIKGGEMELNLGVQSYCFRNFKDNKKVAEMVKELCLDKIELCGVHCDFTDTSKFNEVISIYRDNGVEIVSIGVQGFKNDEATERKYFEFLKMCGGKYMSVDFDINTIPGCFKLADKLAEEYDVKLGIHNHGVSHWLGNVQGLSYVFSNTSVRIGLCLDTAWALDSKANPIEWVDKFKERLYILHLKDFKFDSLCKPEDIVLGEGTLNLEKILEKLKDINFSGLSIIEYEGNPENPSSDIKKGIENLKNLL